MSDPGASPQNLAEVLDATAEAAGGRVAFGSLSCGTTFTELRRLAWQVADRLAATDADRLVVTTGINLLVPASLFGAAYAGRTYAPINGRLPANAMAALGERLRPSVTADLAWLDPVEAEPRPAPGATDVPAVIIFTSGTSAEPKAAVLHHHQLALAALRHEPLSAGADEAQLLAAPPFHVPNILLTLGSIHAGRRIVPLPGDRFSASTWLRTVEVERVTHAMVVPTMLHRIVETLESCGGDVSSLQRLTYGSARMPRPVLERALRLFPTTEFLNGYGLTESGGAVTVLSPDDHRRGVAGDDEDARVRLSSVGRPLPGVELRIVDDCERPVAQGNSGSIQIRAAQVSGAYLNANRQVDHEGWLTSGDRGWLDAAGYLFCEGRGDETIIRGGENIAAAEVEDALLQAPGVAGAAVVGLPDPEWGERIAAMVALRPPLEDDPVAGLQAWVRGQLGSLKTPSTIVVVDELPQTATGKTLRRAVRELLEQT